MSAARVASISATVLAVIALCSMPAEAARPRGPFFWPQLGHWWSNPAPARHSQRHRRAKPKATKPDQAKDAPKDSLQVIVSIADQRISVYDNDALIARSSVSTGVEGHPTPLGVFSVIGKKRWHRSNIYSAAPMPYMQRITWSGIALHAGVVPGHPASHGCIRLKNDFAIRLWHLTRRGTRVIIAPDETGPVEIAHPRLFAATPKVVAGTPEPAAALADNAAITAAAAPPPSTLAADTQQVTDPATSDSTQTTAARRKVRVSVFVSRKSGRLFVRRGYTPLFDVPVTIRDPEQPLGTHVFTVMAPQNEGEVLRWTAVSIPETSPATPDPPKRRARGKQPVETAPVVWSPDQANAALDRIDIPQDAVERISDLLTPGSSLIVSDQGISRETGKDTDFIVLTK
ncbi:MAG TPA: L,D-transpeptidase [Xanthobacteraceae bacterium]|nr:L,D-transpeptidase [Xanthobacteraceae bacterium]